MSRKNRKPQIVDVCVPALQVPPKSFEEMLRRELPVNRILYSDAKPLGTARQQLIEAASTDWFVFVDSDVELIPGWFDIVWSMVDDRTGAVDGLWSYAVQPEVDAFMKATKALDQLLGRSRGGAGPVTRGLTGDTLVLTETVKGIKIPPLPVYEDEFIRRHIIAKGYQWKRTPQVVCLHHRKLNIEQAWLSGYYAHYVANMSAWQAIRNILTIFPRVIYGTAATGMPGIIPMHVERELKSSMGCLSACLNHQELGKGRRVR
jgi:glycosyltransferase involved in cell wall biosynthesis